MIENLIQELRKYKIFGIAIFDSVSSLYFFYYIGKNYFNMKGLNLFLFISSSIPLGYITHKIFNVETPLNKKIDELISTK
jgi:hypothetical protein